ncbi:MAG: hypothetical protein ABI877_15565, partial [Gemmatimonadaceae bacterium]
KQFGQELKICLAEASGVVWEGPAVGGASTFGCDSRDRRNCHQITYEATGPEDSPGSGGNH